jgi:hypothetical protein
MPVDEMKTNDCFHWLSGGCTRGDKCNFKHDPKKKGAGGTPPWFKPTEKKDGVRQSERIKKAPSCSHGGCNSKDPKQEAHHLKQIKEYQNMQNEMVSMKKQIETMNLAARQRTAWGMEECQEGLHVVVAVEAQSDCVGTEVGEKETSHSISFVDHNFWGDPIKPNCDEQKCTNFQSDVSNETCPPIKNQETVLVAAVENARSISIPEHHGHAFVASRTVSTIIDSGATVHIHGDRNSLHGITPCNVKVGVADGQIVTATSKGTWILDSVFRDQQCRAVLENTLLIPGVPYNLVAVSKMVKDGHHFTGATFFKIMLGNVFVVGGIMCNVGLYKVDVNSSIQKALLAPKTCTTGISLIDLWHLRLGHASAPYLKKILKLPANATLSYCDTCMSTSTTTLPFSHKTQSTPMKVQNVLELVMADIVGPFPTRSYQGSNFMAVVVDYASRMKWPLGLAYKSTYVPKYIDWHVFITKHTGKQIKHYHTDGGGAVARSTTLITFHNKMGTKATMNTADQHNQNPIPERH